MVGLLREGIKRREVRGEAPSEHIEVLSMDQEVSIYVCVFL